MKRLLLSAVILCSMLVVIDILVGYLGDKAMTKLPDYSGKLAKDNFRLDRLNTDIVVIGSSRGGHHYVTTMLGDSINAYTHGSYTIYNASIDDKFINSNSCAVESMLDRYTPKLVILEAWGQELAASGKEYSEIRFSEPHYKSNKTVRRFVDAIGWQERVKVLSNMYRYNGKLLRIALSFKVSGENTGYEPLYNKMALPSDENVNKKAGDFSVSQYSMTNFTGMLDRCRENNVNLIVATSPWFRPKDNNDILRQECEKRGIPYVESYDLEQFNDNPSLFHDVGHLNDDGAHIYTNLFFEQIKPYLQRMMQEN